MDPNFYAPQSYHPSFMPIKAKVEQRERGMYSPHAHAEFLTWEGHMHQIRVGDGVGNAFTDSPGTTPEDMGEEMVEAMQSCDDESRHKGHARSHDTSQFFHAYKAVIDQLLSRQYDVEWAYIQWQIYVHNKWGGQMPAAVIMPVEDEMRLMMPDSAGDPLFYPVRKGAVEGLLEMPDGSNTVQGQLGHYTLPSEAQKYLDHRDLPEAERRLRYLKRRGL